MTDGRSIYNNCFGNRKGMKVEIKKMIVVGISLVEGLDFNRKQNKGRAQKITGNRSNDSIRSPSVDDD